MAGGGLDDVRHAAGQHELAASGPVHEDHSLPVRFVGNRLKGVGQYRGFAWVAGQHGLGLVGD